MSEDKTPNSDDAVFDNVETPKIAVKRKSGVGFMSLLALLLSAVALAAVGLGYWRDMAASDAASADTAAEISDLVAAISGAGGGGEGAGWAERGAGAVPQGARVARVGAPCGRRWPEDNRSVSR